MNTAREQARDEWALAKHLAHAAALVRARALAIAADRRTPVITPWVALYLADARHHFRAAMKLRRAAA